MISKWGSIIQNILQLEIEATSYWMNADIYLEKNGKKLARWWGEVQFVTACSKFPRKRISKFLELIISPLNFFLIRALYLGERIKSLQNISCQTLSPINPKIHDLQRYNLLN